ncbi:MAG TPA: CrcB family protein [Phycisphaerales bacterium]|nr:CrcB family protein [Phycisphaerales bacterium]
MDAATPVYVKAAQLALAGAAGTLARWGVYEGCARWLERTGWQLPAATLAVNIAGSFLFGLVWAACDRGQMSMHTRAILLGGFMGAFTTFSSFAFDTGELLARQNYLGAAANVLANTVLGIGAFFVGLWVASLLPRAV